MIYLDNNASTRPAPEAVRAATRALQSDWGNPSSSHGFGRSAARCLSEARAQVGQLAGVDPERVVFTSGATEANEGVLRAFLRRDALLVTSPSEHPALSGVYQHFCPDRIRFVPLDEHGLWRLDALETVLRQGPALVAVAQANGETGVLQDIQEIKNVTNAYGAALLVDASQSMGRIDTANLSLAHFVTFSAHKLHGPKGAGALIVNDMSQDIPMLQVGGGQEGGARGGTENVPGIAGFGAACALRHANFEAHVACLAAVRDQLELRLCDTLDDIRINGLAAPRVPNSSNITFRGVDGMALVARLEDRGVYCSQVSACSSGLPEPSKTLLAMGLSAKDAFSSVRFAVAYDTTLDNIDAASVIIAEEALYLKQVMGCLL